MKRPRSGTISRTLDRFAGVALLAALGAARRLRGSRRPPASPRRIGLLMTNAIGDTVLMSAIVRDLAACFPDAEIVFFPGPQNAAVSALLPDVTRVHVLPLFRPWDAVRVLRRETLDLLIDCGSWPRINAVLAAFSGAGYTIGFRTAGQGRHYAFDHGVLHDRTKHELENYRDIARAVGVPVGSAPLLRPGTFPPDAPAGRFAVCHLWAGGHNGWRKEWPAERWRAVVRALLDEGLDVVLTGSAEDVAASADFERYCSRHGMQVANLAGRSTLAELAALLERSAMVVSVNTGIMHMAAAVGAPTVDLHGPTRASRWGGVGSHVRAVESALPGCGFLNLGWEYRGQREDCMLGVDADAVVGAVRELLREHAERPARVAADRP